jgi:putative flippase GtrA
LGADADLVPVLKRGRPLRSIPKRLGSRKAARLLARNTTVSVGTFLGGLGFMWVLVELLGANKVFAAGVSFLAVTSLHYVFGRAWVFRGSERGLVTGYGYFLVIAGVGLLLTVSLFAALLSWTSINYLVARVIVSLVAGLLMFALNGMLNFRQL